MYRRRTLAGLICTLILPVSAGAGPGELPPSSPVPPVPTADSSHEGERALADLLDTVASIRDAENASRRGEAGIGAMISRLRSDFGRYRTQADGAARLLKELKAQKDTESGAKLAKEHSELSRKAEDARAAIEILECLSAAPDEEVLGIPPGDGIHHGDLDGIAAWIDGVFERVWKMRGIHPAPAVSPASFLRRAFLDIAGTIPPREALERYLSRSKGLTRGALIDEILGYENAPGGGYARNFARIWGVELLGRGYLPDDKHRQPFLDWLELQFSRNARYDRWVTELLTVTTKNTKEVSPTVFLAARQSNAVANTTKITTQFLGIDMQCAECHDHPYQRWTQDNFHGLVAFFARQREKDIGGNVYVLHDAGDGEAGYQTPSGENRAASMRYHDGTRLEDDSSDPPEKRMSRREIFARKMVSDLQFARARVNRMWAHLMGRGLVHPVDGFTSENPPSVPLVLDLLATKFQESGFDQMWLLRVLARTRVYGLDGLSGGGDSLPDGTFAGYPVKALTGEQMFDSIVVASGLDTALEREKGESAGKVLASFRDEFLEVYAWEPEEVTDPNEGTLPQALALLNNRLIIEASSPRPGSAVEAALSIPEPERIDFLYRAALVRDATPPERDRALAFLAAARDPAAAAGDLLWTLINSAEFRYNH